MSRLPSKEFGWRRWLRPRARGGEPRFIVLGRHRRRWIRVVAWAVPIAWVGLWVSLVAFERRLTYVPDPTRTSPAEVRLAGVVEQELRTPDGERLVVWRAMAQAGRPTILYFHGNGDPLTYRSGRIAAFQAEGWGVYIMAYRGFAGSTGRPSEAAIVADAMLAYETLIGQGVAPTRIVLYGESLGTHVALRVAVAKPAAALILEAPFTSMVDEWRRFMPIVPVSLTLRDRFESTAIIGKLEKPLLVLHGVRDRIVPFALGRRLYEAAPDPKRFEAFPEAGHTNLYGYNAIAAVRRFIEDVEAGALGR